MTDPGSRSAAIERAPIVAVLLMVASTFLFASNDAIGKHLTQTYSIWQVLWVRSWVWLAFTWIWVARHGGIRQALRSHHPVLQGLRSLILVAEITVFIMSFRFLPLGDVTAILAASPLVVVVLAVLFLRERVGWHRWAAVAVGFTGMMLIARPGFSSFGLLTLLPLLGVTLWSIYQILVRHVSHRDTAETTLLWSGCAIFAVMTVVAPWSWQTPPDLATWGWFGLVGLTNTLGHFSLILAMHRAQASALQPFAFSAVAWALVLGWLAFGERPDVLTSVGILAIVTAGLYAVYRERRVAAP